MEFLHNVKIGVAVIAVVLVLFFVVRLVIKIQNETKIADALSQLEQGERETALQVSLSLSGFSKNYKGLDELKYLLALGFIEDELYHAAYNQIVQVLDYQDARDIYIELRRGLNPVSIALHETYLGEELTRTAVAITSDGSVISSHVNPQEENYTGNPEPSWFNALDAEVNNTNFGIVTTDSRYVVQDDIDSYRYGLQTAKKPLLQAVIAGSKEIVLYEDGTVEINGKKFWNDIVAIKVSGDGLAGLKADGTIVTIDLNQKGIYINNLYWDNIMMIDIENNLLVGVTYSGDVESVRKWNLINDDNYMEENDWPPVKMVSVSDTHCAGLTMDNKVVICRESSLDEMSWGYRVENWKNIVSVSTDTYTTVGISSEGEVMVSSRDEFIEQCLKNWNDIAHFSGVNKIVKEMDE